MKMLYVKNCGLVLIKVALIFQILYWCVVFHMNQNCESKKKPDFIFIRRNHSNVHTIGESSPVVNMAVKVNSHPLGGVNLQGKALSKNSSRKPKNFSEIEDLRPLDTELLEYIKDYHLYAPSVDAYNLTHPDKDPSEFHEALQNLFQDTNGGIFIECGANDGEFLSNTLELERTFGWTGILIEANPLMIPKLLAKNRKAFILDVGLSPSLHPEKISFLDWKGNK